MLSEAAVEELRRLLLLLLGCAVQVIPHSHDHRAFSRLIMTPVWFYLTVTDQSKRIVVEQCPRRTLTTKASPGFALIPHFQFMTGSVFTRIIPRFNSRLTHTHAHARTPLTVCHPSCLQCEEKEAFIQQIQSLDIETQAAIASCIQQVGSS